MKKLGIITVVTNEKQNLTDFFHSLASQSLRDFTLYFVDNNSKDDSQEFFRELNRENLLDVKYITLDHNSGFSEGSNTGAEAAIKDGCEFLYISNNDIVFADDALGELMKMLETDTSLACTGPLVMQHKIDNPGLIQEFGGHINFKKGTLDKYYTNRKLGKVDLPETLETDFIGGGALFIRSDVFKKAEMFEISYFGYFDEIDLSYRLKVGSNLRMAVTSKAVVWHNHYWEKKNNYKYYFEYYLTQRNKFLYYHKYRLYASMIKMLLADLIKFPWRLKWFIKVCDYKVGIYYLKGMADGLLNRKGRPKLSFMK